MIEKTEISIWIFILLVIIVGFVIGLIMSFFTNTKVSKKYKQNNETDDYSYIDFD